MYVQKRNDLKETEVTKEPFSNFQNGGGGIYIIVRGGEKKCFNIFLCDV